MVFLTFNDVWFFFSISYTLNELIDGVGFSFSTGKKDSKMYLKVNRQRKRCDISLEWELLAPGGLWVPGLGGGGGGGGGGGPYLKGGGGWGGGGGGGGGGRGGTPI